MPDYLKLEQIEARRDGAKPIKNSGRGIVKGDAQLDNFTVDYKMVGKSFTVNQSVWAKACSDAMSNDYSDPALKIVINNETRLWIIDDTMFKQMHEAWKEKYDQ